METTLTFNANTAQFSNLQETEVRALNTMFAFEHAKKKDAYFRLAKKHPGVRMDTNEYLFDTDTLEFPTGLCIPAIELLHQRGYTVHVNRQIERILSQSYNLPDWLYDYQSRAISLALKVRRGIFILPTAAGKSVIIAYFLAHFPHVKCLLMTETVDLLKSLRHDLSELLKEPIGQVGGGKHKWERVTVGLPGSMKRYIAMSDEECPLTDIKVLVIDECHHAASKSYQAMASKLIRSDYRIGLTAALERSDGHEILARAILGNEVMELKPEEIFGVTTMKPEYLMVSYNHDAKGVPQFKHYITGEGGNQVYATDSGEPNYTDVFSEAIANNPERAEFVVDILHEVLTCPDRKGSILVIAERSDLANLLRLKAKEKYGYDWVFVHKDTRPKQRTQIIQDLDNGSLDLAIACQVFNEGVNIPNLEFVVNTSGGGTKSGRLIQKIGRTNRRGDRVERAVFIDIADYCHWYLSSQTRRRADKVDEQYPTCRKFLNREELRSFLLDPDYCPQETALGQWKWS